MHAWLSGSYHPHRPVSETEFLEEYWQQRPLHTGGSQVRKTPSWPRSWALGPTSAFYSCVPTGMHKPACHFWANLTPFSL
jgi:hypothetical protein